MTGITRLPLLALMAVVGALFAIPAVASAAEWTQEGEPLVKPAKIQLVGFYDAEGSNVGYGCEGVTVDLTLQPGDEGEVTQVSYGGTCKGQANWSFCGSFANKAVSLPWDIQATAGGISVPDVDETRKWNSSSPCKGHWEGLFESSWVLTPDSYYEMGSVSLFGQSHSLMGAVQGEFEILPAGIYGIQ